MSTARSDKEWRILNAATDVLRDHGQPLHVDLLTEIIAKDYWHWNAPAFGNDPAPTVEQVRRALNRNLNLDSGEIRVPWGRLTRILPAVWSYRRVD